jgi:hypothetical protein
MPCCGLIILALATQTATRICFSRPLTVKSVNSFSMTTNARLLGFCLFHRIASILRGCTLAVKTSFPAINCQFRAHYRQIRARLFERLSNLIQIGNQFRIGFVVSDRLIRLTHFLKLFHSALTRRNGFGPGGHASSLFIEQNDVVDSLAGGILATPREKGSRKSGPVFNQ